MILNAGRTAFPKCQNLTHWSDFEPSGRRVAADVPKTHLRPPEALCGAIWGRLLVGTALGPGWCRQGDRHRPPRVRSGRHRDGARQIHEPGTRGEESIGEFQHCLVGSEIRPSGSDPHHQCGAVWPPKCGCGNDGGSGGPARSRAAMDEQGARTVPISGKGNQISDLLSVRGDETSGRVNDIVKFERQHLERAHRRPCKLVRAPEDRDCM